MGLLTISDEVLKKRFLPLLSWNDLLRLRRVSKRLKELVTGYMREHPELSPEIEINEEDKTFKDFLKMDIPTTKLYVNNVSGPEFYDKAGKTMTTFLEKYGPLVKQLRVQELGLYICGKEWTFLDNFTKLEALEAHHFGMGTKGQKLSLERKIALNAALSAKAKRDLRYLFGVPPIPQVFGQLKYLKIGQEEEDCVDNLSNRHDGFMGVCPKLEYLGLPLTLKYDDSMDDYEVTMIRVFGSLGRNLILGQGANLKFVDFFSFYNLESKMAKRMAWWAMAKGTFGVFLKVAKRTNLKLLNVGAAWMEDCVKSSPEIGNVVGSLVNIQPWVLSLDMPNLERIEIKASSDCQVGSSWKQDRASWSALKVLDITVDSKEETKDLFQFLFEDVKRLALTELRLNFVKEEVGVPKVEDEDIVVSCPNLKKLTIVNWPGKNKGLISLWEGLPGLEEITLDNCKNVGNVTFVGMDTKNPVFFKLKKLLKLTLKKVDQMPKITDLLFSLVIRHLGLKCFEITAERPLEQLTAAGINALLEGKFAESIEKFPFQGWFLKDLSVKEFQALGNKFRSSDML